MLDLFVPLLIAQENPPLVMAAEERTTQALIAQSVFIPPNRPAANSGTNNPDPAAPTATAQNTTGAANTAPNEPSANLEPAAAEMDAEPENQPEDLLPHQPPIPTEDQPPQPESFLNVITESQTVRPLPGGLNQVPVFNSNSPEVIAQEGILLSTFPQSGKAQPNAHLELPLGGRFDIFTHHISRPAGEKRTLYQGLLVSNPTGRTRTLRVLRGLSYLNKEAPFRELLPYVEDPGGYVYSGPGSRLVGDLLRGQTQSLFPELVRIPPYSMITLANLPIPVSGARSTYLQVETDGSIYLANLAQYEVKEERIILEQGEDGEMEEKTITFWRPPVLDEWRSLLSNGKLVEPRDRAPVPVKGNNGIIYGRVAGISVGNEWVATVGDRPDVDYLTIPEVDQPISFPISTTSTGTFGTDQIQSAAMAARYSDTALQGHGNYLVYYNLTFPLKNPTKEAQRVALTFQTPIKENNTSDRLNFFETPPDRIFFRGAVRITYADEFGDPVEKYVHLVQRRGERSEPLAIVEIPPGKTSTATIDFFYPPDATPPQVITVKTLPPELTE